MLLFTLMLIALIPLLLGGVWGATTVTVTANNNGATWDRDYPRGLHVKALTTTTDFLPAPLHLQQDLFLTCQKTYGSYFYIQQALPFLSASLACQSMGALLASIVTGNHQSLLNLYTWCSVGTPSTLLPWVSGNSVAGNCPILTSDADQPLMFTTTVACNGERGAMCQRVSQVIQSFSTTTTFITSQVTVSATLSLTSTTTSTRISTLTASTTIRTTVSTTSVVSTTVTATSTVVVVTGTTSTTGVFPSPTTTSVTEGTVVDTDTTSVTGIRVTVTTVTRSTTTFSNTPVFTQIVCPFIIPPSQSSIQTV